MSAWSDISQCTKISISQNLWRCKQVISMIAPSKNDTRKSPANKHGWMRSRRKTKVTLEKQTDRFLYNCEFQSWKYWDAPKISSLLMCAEGVKGVEIYFWPPPPIIQIPGLIRAAHVSLSWKYWDANIYNQCQCLRKGVYCFSHKIEIYFWPAGCHLEGLSQ